jgi:hypothetical protein
MGSFTWIYAPAILLAAVFVVAPLRRALAALQRGYTVLLLLAVQYALQWIDQFVRDGNGLEISYYWSFVYPSFAIAFAMVLGTAAWTIRSTAIFVAIWWLMLALTQVDSLILPAGWVFALVCLAILAGLACGLARHAILTVGVLAALVLATQTNSPDYDPTAYHPYNVDPQYDEIFYNSNSGATQMFREAIWLERELDELPDDTDMYFFGTGNGVAVIGIYGTHVTGKWIVPDETGHFPQAQVDDAAGGRIRRVALFAHSAIVDDAVARLGSSAGGRVQLRRTDPIVEGYDLAVVEMPSAGGA